MTALSASSVRHQHRGGFRGAMLRVATVAVVFTVLSCGAAWAQIYVVVEADGTRRFTNEPTSAGSVFLETRFSLAPVSVNPRALPFQQEIANAAQRAGVDAKLVEAVIAAESAFDPQALSKKGAQGLMQLMPDTADRFGVANVWDPQQNIAGGTAYLRWLIDEFDGDVRHVLAAYNAGEGAVTRYGGVPPYTETREYVDRVLTYYRQFGGQSALAVRLP
jgi:soluble lytic murein transglycosylase-like protein